MTHPAESDAHGNFWPSDYVLGEDPSCLCGYNGTPDECAASRRVIPAVVTEGGAA